jgi:hypothetical protein
MAAVATTAKVAVPTPVSVAAAVTAKDVATAVAGSILYSPSAGCVTTIVNGLAYQ